MSIEKAKAKQIQVEANTATPAGTLQELIETRKILPTATTTLDGAMSKEDKAKLEDLTPNSELITTLNGKVDKVTGKGLSTNDYSNADKAKLASLESSHFRGVYINEAALATIPDPVAGDYADIDTGAGSDAERWIYDASDSKWIVQGSATSVTASQVKQLYESNADTNAFTDTEKTKLSALPTNQTLTTQLDTKADKTTQVVAGTGLSGGGTLAANRTLSVNYGTTEGTAAQGNDSRLSNSREWTAGTISQAEAEAGTATTRRAFTAQRVRQAVVAWFNSISSALGRTILSRTTAAEVRSDIGLGNAATRDVGTASGTVAAGDDARLTNSREWTASTVSQAEAEAGTATTARKWTAQRVAQAINALGLKIGTTATTAKAGNWMPTWANVTGKPTEFTPSSHTHSLSEVSGAGNLAALNTNDSTANFLRGDGEWVTPPNTNTVTSVRANNTGTYRTGNINIIGGTNVTVSEGAAGQFTIAATGTSTTYSAGSGLSLSGTTFSLPVTVSGTGSYVQSVAQDTNGLTVTLGTPPDTNTTYSEITTAIIDAGTSSALHTISGRRMKYALDKKADASHTHAWAEVTDKPIVQTTGTSTTDIMSQKAVTEAIADIEIDLDIVQETGQSETAIMSQKATTDAIKNNKNIYTPERAWGAYITRNWTSRAVVSNAWLSITWSPKLGMFAAVANAGTDRVMTSTDGITWTTRPVGDSVWSSITWSPELSMFVAVASDSPNRVMTSTDGITWTPRTVEPSAWQSVTWSPELGMFVAVADIGSYRVMTSTDGINWTRRVGASGSWQSVTWSPELGIFVAVASNGQAMTSTDGINWTSIVAVASMWESVTWSPELGIFVAVAYNGTKKVMTSTDGIVWTPRDAVDGQWYSVTWSPELGIFVAVGTTGSNRVMISTDGVTWSPRSVELSTWNSVTWSPELGRFVAVAHTGTNRVLTTL